MSSQVDYMPPQNISNLKELMTYNMASKQTSKECKKFLSTLSSLILTNLTCATVVSCTTL